VNRRAGMLDTVVIDDGRFWCVRPRRPTSSRRSSKTTTRRLWPNSSTPNATARPLASSPVPRGKCRRPHGCAEEEHRWRSLSQGQETPASLWPNRRKCSCRSRARSPRSRRWQSLSAQLEDARLVRTSEPLNRAAYEGSRWMSLSDQHTNCADDVLEPNPAFL
jgi:hypothetical protein